MTEKELLRLVAEPGFADWLNQIHRVHGCAHPIYLAGRTVIRDPESGAVLHEYSTATAPGGKIAVRCRNRRQSVCAPCSWVHAGDTWHLVRAGLLGGKGVPPTVSRHPRVFVTLTAPSFGPVHRLGEPRHRCRPRRDAPLCPHGRDLSCAHVHSRTDPLIGQPLCGQCYRYADHVLWNATAPELWSRTVRVIRRRLAAAGDIPRSKLKEHLGAAFTKVAEFQKRGAIHYHAVMRLDGADGPASAPPEWATIEALSAAIVSAVQSVYAPLPYAPEIGHFEARWGTQLDIHPITVGRGAVSDQAVAAYIAKYITKDVGSFGGTDRPLLARHQIARRPVSRHFRALMRTCWDLGDAPALASLRLRARAHTLGYGGQALTKSRRYATTYGELRAARAAHAGPALPVGEVDAAWRFVGSGHTPAEAELAAGVASDIAWAREAANEVRDG
ncbi:replication initiator [Streptomyces buecherae]|uniref:replication initiator n=1 Tax=Streptomyces buecherae TaxID=2763006 RepID=UPI003683AC01